MAPEEIKEHMKRAKLGQLARDFLVSPEWKELVDPILVSMISGLKDATTIDVSSDKKAAIEVKSRTLAAEYIEKIGLLIKAHVNDGEVSQKILEKQKNKEEPEVLPLYKVEE